MFVIHESVTRLARQNEDNEILVLTTGCVEQSRFRQPRADPLRRDLLACAIRTNLERWWIWLRKQSSAIRLVASGHQGEQRASALRV
jgi:hypothetical protein